MMPGGGFFLIVLSATLLKPLLSSNQIHPLIVVDFSNDALPEGKSIPDPNGTAKFVSMLQLWNLLAKNSYLNAKRQFDPWGGKRLPRSLSQDHIINHKKQFSPWGGKRSIPAHFERTKESEEPSVEKSPHNGDITFSKSKKSFNSWGGKRSFNSWGGKRNFNAWDGKRVSSNMRNIGNFSGWGDKSTFSSWEGKKSLFFPNANKILYPFGFNKNEDDKRKKFNSWAGKRTSNAWNSKWNN